MRFRDVQNGVHLTGLATEMDWCNRLEARTMLTSQFQNALFKTFGVDIERVRLDIYKLYHLLNHLLIFGQTYRESCMAVLRRYAAL